MLLEPRPFRPFKTSEEYLYAMKEDLADWLNNLYSLDINVDNFFERLDTGEVLCAVSTLSGDGLHASYVMVRDFQFHV